MLIEQFIASSRTPPAPPAGNTPQLKDAGIFVHQFQPQPALQHTFKKSQSEKNCVEFNDTHVFAAQTGKAVVNVYSRDTGKQEAIIPFPERIRCLSLANDDTILVLGTEAGQIQLWEIYTGRIVTAPQSHLQAVTVLATDIQGHFLLTGSPDALVVCWCVGDIMSFPSLHMPGMAPDEPVKPRHTLTGHSAGITSLVFGNGSSPNNVAFSAAEDKTIAVWDYQGGVQLRTILLSDVPRCLALDPADRAIYTGFDDGSVQRVDFFDAYTIVNSLHDPEHKSAPLQPPASSRWHDAAIDSAETPSKATLSISLSYDATILLSGHENGAINKWDVATGRFAGAIAQYNGAPVTNIHFECPEMLKPKQSWRGVTVVKPRPHEPFSRTRPSDRSKNYAMQIQMLGSASGLHLHESSLEQSWHEQWAETRRVAEAILSKRAGKDSTAKTSASSGLFRGEGDDFIMLESGLSPDGNVEGLQQRVTAMEKQQKLMGTELARLRRDRKEMKARENERLAKRAKKEQQRQTKANQGWEMIGRGQQAAVGMIPEQMRLAADSDDEDKMMADEGSTTSASAS